MDDLKQRYRALPMWARLLIGAVLGVAYPAYTYLEEVEALEQQLTAAQGELETAKSKFEKARQEKGDLPKLEEKLAYTEEQLLKAKKKLPDDYRIEDILQKAATIAKEVGVKLVSFRPSEEILKGDQVKYMELPIATEIEGRFSQIAAFLDRVVHLETSVFVRNVDVATASQPEAELNPEAPGNAKLSVYERSRRARQNVSVSGRFDLVIFRAASDAEVAQEGAGAPAPGGPGAAGLQPAVPAPPAAVAPPRDAAAPPAGDAASVRPTDTRSKSDARRVATRETPVDPDQPTTSF